MEGEEHSLYTSKPLWSTTIEPQVVHTHKSILRGKKNRYASKWKSLKRLLWKIFMVCNFTTSSMEGGRRLWFLLLSVSPQDYRQKVLSCCKFIEDFPFHQGMIQQYWRPPCHDVLAPDIWDFTVNNIQFLLLTKENFSEMLTRHKRVNQNTCFYEKKLTIVILQEGNV